LNTQRVDYIIQENTTGDLVVLVIFTLSCVCDRALLRRTFCAETVKNKTRQMFGSQ